jgi:hypothetical protein
MSAERTLLARPRWIVAFFLAVPFTLLISVLIAKYWGYFRLGTAGGNGMALAMVVIPISLVLNWGLAILVLGRSSLRGASRNASIVLTCIAFLALSSMLFFIEVWRTSRLQTEGGQTLAGFFKALM